MNRSIINLIVTVLLAYIWAMLSMDWWSAMLAGAIAASMVPLKGFKVFLMPFLGIFLFWSIYAYILSSANDFRLAKQIGVLFNIGEQPYLVILITGLIGGLAAGIAGIFGKQLANLKGKK
jgi:hypothetical protein